jgi:hypothetical protein
LPATAAASSVANSTASADLAPGHLVEQRCDEVGFPRKVTIHGAGRDAGAFGHRRNLHRRHATFARCLVQSIVDAQLVNHDSTQSTRRSVLSRQA